MPKFYHKCCINIIFNIFFYYDYIGWILFKNYLFWCLHHEIFFIKKILCPLHEALFYKWLKWCLIHKILFFICLSHETFFTLFNNYLLNEILFIFFSLLFKNNFIIITLFHESFTGLLYTRLLFIYIYVFLFKEKIIIIYM